MKKESELPGLDKAIQETDVMKLRKILKDIVCSLDKKTKKVKHLKK